MRFRLGSRGSPLALWQARHIAAKLEKAWPELTVDITIIKTEGDQRADVPLRSSFGAFEPRVRQIDREGKVVAVRPDVARKSLCGRG